MLIEVLIIFSCAPGGIICWEHWTVKDYRWLCEGKPSMKGKNQIFHCCLVYCCYKILKHMELPVLVQRSAMSNAVPSNMY